MARPSGNVPEDNLNNSSDTPDDAREDLLELVQQHNEAVASYGEPDGISTLDSDGRVPDGQLGRSIAGGVAALDQSGKVPASQLPAAEAATGLAVNVTKDGYTGSHDRGVADIAFAFVTGASGVTLNVTITYFDRTV